jgi:preprotein translocase subunit SecD
MARGASVRSRPGYSLLAILVLAIVAGWLALPSSWLDVAGIKDDVDINEGLDLQGGVQLLLEADPPEGTNVDSDVMQGVRDTIERRVNGLGVSEPVVQTRGDNQVVVELAGATDPEEATRIVQRTALLEIIDTQGQVLAPGTIVTTSLGGPDSVETDAATPAASPVGSPTGSPVASPVGSPADGSPVATPLATDSPTPTGGTVYTTIVSGGDLKDAYLTQGNLNEIAVGFELKGSGSDRFFEFTSSHIGQFMAIVIDKRVISSPQINDAISSNGQITGVDAQEARELVVQLKAGALNVPLKVVQSRTVGPTLGKDSIDRSIIAGIVGLGAVALFMIIFYRLPGLMSVLALLLYTAVTFSLFKLLNVTLTLAGIAGFILSIGMAVDANVLIFARLKEELRSGRSLAAAIEAGFEHAWPSIRDSNISSMITSAILYWFGRYTGASIITGFALTLFIGVTVSMFTAIVVTRTFLRLLIGLGLDRNRWLFAVMDEPPEPIAATTAD